MKKTSTEGRRARRPKPGAMERALQKAVQAAEREPHVQQPAEQYFAAQHVDSQNPVQQQVVPQPVQAVCSENTHAYATELEAQVNGDGVPRAQASGGSEAASMALRGYATMLRTVGNAGWGWLQAQQKRRAGGRRLRVIETVSLGEKRFAALLAVDGAEFLIGGAGSSVALLASVEGGNSARGFAHALETAAGQAQ
jgi:flagellar biogenesis protein FliO